MTMGADRPPYGDRQRKFWPLRAHFSTRPVSFETPSRLGASSFGPVAQRHAPRALGRRHQSGHDDQREKEAQFASHDHGVTPLPVLCFTSPM